MKYLLFCTLGILFYFNLSAQDKHWLMESLDQIENNTFEGLIINDSLVAKFIYQYKDEVLKHDINLERKFETINWILIEPESNISQELTGFNLGKINRDRKLILLSRACLLDRGILKATLFRELSHYLGLPYNTDCCEIMRINKPKGYSYAWIDDIDIREIEFYKLFIALKNI